MKNQQPYKIENGIKHYNFKHTSEEALLLKTNLRRTSAVEMRKYRIK